MDTQIVIPQIVFYSLIVVFIFVVLMLAAVLFWFRRVMLKIYSLKIKGAKADDIMAEAQAQSVEIVYKARDHAAKIIDEAVKLSEDQRILLKNALDKAINQYSDEYKKMLSDIKVKANGVLSEEVQAMGQELSSQNARLQIDLASKINDEYRALHTRVQEYRSLLLEKVRESISDLIHDVTLEVIGKSLTAKDHEEIIIRALDSAKKRNVF